MEHRKDIHYKDTHSVIRIAIIFSLGFHLLLFSLVGQVKKRALGIGHWELRTGKERDHSLMKVALVDTLTFMAENVSEKPIKTSGSQAGNIKREDKEVVKMTPPSPIPSQKESEDLLANHLPQEGTVNPPLSSILPSKNELREIAEAPLIAGNYEPPLSSSEDPPPLPLIEDENEVSLATMSLKIAKTNQSETYIHTIYTKLLQQRKYPAAAQRRGLEGTVNIRFLIHKDGTVSTIKIIQGSHYSMLDKAAIETIQAGTPYPPFPSGIEENSMWIVVPIVYSLLE